MMEGCLAVEREQDKVLKKLKTLSGSSAEKLQKLIDQITILRKELQEGREPHTLFDAHSHKGFLVIEQHAPWCMYQ